LLGCNQKLAQKNSIEHLQTCATLKRHLTGIETTPGYLIRVQDRYRRNLYWLVLAVPKTSILRDIDMFLREIWLECCGHLSSFRRSRGTGKFDVPISDLKIGEKIEYEYDFGSSTNLTLIVEGAITCPVDKKVTLLMRNIAPQYPCERCCGGKKRKIDTVYATILCDQRALCDACRNIVAPPKKPKRSEPLVDSTESPDATATATATDAPTTDIAVNTTSTAVLEASTDVLATAEGEEAAEEEEEEEDDEYGDDSEDDDYWNMIHPLVNSPRAGVCGYTGEESPVRVQEFVNQWVDRDGECCPTLSHVLTLPLSHLIYRCAPISGCVSLRGARITKELPQEDSLVFCVFIKGINIDGLAVDIPACSLAHLLPCKHSLRDPTPLSRQRINCEVLVFSCRGYCPPPSQ
jgi:hypothetical protein